MRLEPAFRRPHIWAQIADLPPEGLRMIHVTQMRDFMRRKIIKDIGRSENQSPGEIQASLGRAGAPTACRIPQCDPCRRPAKNGGVPRDGGLDIGTRVTQTTT